MVIRSSARLARVLLVAVGGALGTAARQGVLLAAPAGGAVPWGVLLANLLGAFLLGALLERLVRLPDTTRPETWRLLLGTGFLGGFTTYSTLAAGTAGLAGHGDVVTSTAYGLGTVVLGLAATGAGVLVGARSVALPVVPEEDEAP